MNLSVLKIVIALSLGLTLVHLSRDFGISKLIQEDKTNIYDSDYSYRRSDGSDFDFRGLKNKVVLLDVWASWCAGCIDDHHLVVDLKERIDSPDFEIVYVSTERDTTNWRKFITDNNWHGIHITVPRTLENPLSNIVYTKSKVLKDGRTQYQVGVPSYFLISKNGQGHKTVSPGNKKLEEEVRRLLAE